MSDGWNNPAEKIPDAFESVLVFIPTQFPFPTVREGYIVDDINGIPQFWFVPALKEKFDIDGFIVAWTSLPDPPKEV